VPRPAGDGGGPLTGPGPDDPGLLRTALRPRWLGLLLIALGVAGVMTAMGVWQLDVYQSKTAEATARRAEQPPVAFESLVPLDAGLSGQAVGRRVDVTGEWAPAADQLFVSGRQQDGRDGYWVVTPVLLGSGAAVLVVRGWVARPDDPAAAAPNGPVTVHGTVLASESGGADDLPAGRVVPSLRIPGLVGLVDYRLYDAFVLLSASEPSSSAGPEVVPPPAPPTDHAGIRNVAYAVQWWIFAAFTLFMWWRMVRDAHHDRAREPESTVSA
jgi:cytochrome oxidase assembly protein ShyY1